MRGRSYTKIRNMVIQNDSRNKTRKYEIIDRMEDRLEETNTLQAYYKQGLEMIKDLNEDSYYVLWLNNYNPGSTDFEILVQCKTLGRDRSLFSILVSTGPLRATSTAWSSIREHDIISLSWDPNLWGIKSRPDLPGDLPLYVSWPYKTKLFEKLLKKGIPNVCPKDASEEKESEITPK